MSLSLIKFKFCPSCVKVSQYIQTCYVPKLCPLDTSAFLHFCNHSEILRLFHDLPAPSTARIVFSPSPICTPGSRQVSTPRLLLHSLDPGSFREDPEKLEDHRGIPVVPLSSPRGPANPWEHASRASPLVRRVEHRSHAPVSALVRRTTWSGKRRG